MKELWKGSLEQLQRNCADLKIDASYGYVFSVSSFSSAAFHCGLLSTLVDIFRTMYRHILVGMIQQNSKIQNLQSEQKVWE